MAFEYKDIIPNIPCKPCKPLIQGKQENDYTYSHKKTTSYFVRRKDRMSKLEDFLKWYEESEGSKDVITILKDEIKKYENI